MSKSLKSLRDYVKSTKNTGGSFERDHTVYPHWNLGFNASTTVRLLPDGNPDNQAPWVTKKTIPCVFPDPENENNTVKFFVPCREMYGANAKCPALQPVRDLYKEAAALKKAGNTLESERIKKIAGKHWLDQTFYYNAIVMKSGLVEEGRPADASPIRTLQFSKQIQGVIETSLGLVMDENAPPSQFSDDELPCGTFSMEDVNRLLAGEVGEDEMDEVLAKFVGTPFVIVKKQKGEYANYESSFFQMREKHELTPDDLHAMQTHGLPNLGEKYLPKQPTDAEYEILKEIVLASINNEEWNPAWEEAGFKFFRPRSKDGEGDTGGSTGGSAGGATNSIASRVRNNLGGGETAGASSGLASAMNRRRAAAPAAETTEETAPAAKAETVAETAPEAAPEVAETPVAETPATPATTAPAAGAKDPKALAAMIKARMGGAK